MKRLRIQTASRLHFGLLGWGSQAIRQFGGLGLMIEQPGIEVIAEPASAWSFEGHLADRVRSVVHLAQERGRDGGIAIELPPAQLHVVSAPSEHVGLGVGTQLGLTVVRALLELAGAPEPTMDCLVRLSARGRRSGIGLHGFLHGGLIVDGGRGALDQAPPLLTRLPFPDDWSILLVQPAGPPGRHGTDELRAFADLPPFPERISERLCRLVLLGILPAVVERDLQTFGQAVAELQDHVGSAFAALQGGRYASPQAESIIADLKNMGLVGAGQSSWGPTLFAFGATPETDQRAITSRILDRWELPPEAVTWTRAANHGAIMETLESLDG